MENDWLTWAAGILSAINGAFLIYSAWVKLKPEVKKMDTEVELDNIGVAEKSQQMLIDRINELEELITEERNHRKQELEAERANWRAELESERESRRRDRDYFQRRFLEADGEARAYRRWAAALVKQVVDAGRTPAIFVPFSEESQQGITPIRVEEEDKK
jgi:hypothetical protein